MKTGPRDLRKFGLMVGGILALLGLWFWWRGKPYAAGCLIPGILLTAAGLIFPKLLKYVYLGWMSASIVLGFVVSHIILSVFFFLVVSPLALAGRVAGKDFLNLKIDRAARTYWVPRPKRKDRQGYEQQF